MTRKEKWRGKVRLGRTHLLVSQIPFVAIPMQRVGMKEAITLVRRVRIWASTSLIRPTRMVIREEKTEEATKGGRRKDIVIVSEPYGPTNRILLEDVDLSQK